MTSMCSVQLGSALSVHLIAVVGAAGTAWLRLSIGALLFLALARPPLSVWAEAAGLAVLLPVLPYACELLALRRMTQMTFGTLMALEPAFGVLLGPAVLHQSPSVIQVAGILLVIVAGAAAQRDSRGGQDLLARPDDRPGEGEAVADGREYEPAGSG